MGTGIFLVNADGQPEPLGAGSSDSGSAGPVLTVRSIGPTRPETSGWSINDAWIDTSDPETDGNVIRLWTGGAFSPAEAGAPALGDLLMADDFSGVDGSAWDASKWASGRNASLGTGGGVTLLGGNGRISASDYGNFAGESMFSRRALIGDQSDINADFRFRFDSTTGYFAFHVRHGTTVLDREDGYVLMINNVSGEWEILKLTDYTSETLGTAQDAPEVDDEWVPGKWYRARFRVVGTSLKARVWEDGDTEPSTWPVDVTDSTYTAAGKTGVSMAGGATSTLPRNFYIDDLSIRDS